MISTHCGTAMEFLPHTQHVAHFYCQCSPIGNQYRGSLSQILSDPLSTIPLLHLVNANVTILVELKNCLKLKLSLDVTELLLQRAMSSANVDFVLKVTFYFHVHVIVLLTIHPLGKSNFCYKSASSAEILKWFSGFFLMNNENKTISYWDFLTLN